MTSNKRHRLLDWLGLLGKWQFGNAPRLGKFVGFGVVAIAILYIFATMATFFLFVTSVWVGLENGDVAKTGSIRNWGLVLGALLGTPILIWRVI